MASILLGTVLKASYDHNQYTWDRNFFLRRYLWFNSNSF